MALLSGAIIYVKVATDRLSLRNIDTGRSIDLVAESPFSDKRMLVGNFANAEALLKRGVKEISGSWFSPSPSVLIQPLERVDGGLNQVEQRLYRELALGAGARRVIVWSGDALSDAEVKAKLASLSRAA